MVVDSGDGAPEVAKRKIGDSEPGESEDPRGQNEQNSARREMSRERHRRLGGVRRKIKIRSGAEESKNLGDGVGVNQFNVAKEIVAVSVGESDLKSDKTVFEFTYIVWRECEQVEMERFKKHGMCEKVSIEECRWETCEGPA